MLTLDQFTQMIAAGFSGMFVGTIVFGMGSDYFGRRASFVLMLLIYSVCTLFGAFAPNAWALIVWRGLAGVGIGAELVVIDTYVTEMLPSKARGRYVAITQLVGFTAIPVVALLSKLLVPTEWLLDGWRWVMVIGGVGGLFAWYIRRRLPESPRWCEARGRHREADTIMQEIELEVMRETGRPLDEPQPVAVAQSEHMPIRELWQPAYRGRTLMLMVFHLLQTVGLYGFANWAPTFPAETGQESRPIAGVWISDRLGQPHWPADRCADGRASRKEATHRLAVTADGCQRPTVPVGIRTARHCRRRCASHHFQLLVFSGPACLSRRSCSLPGRAPRV
jgi:putative MFS transporter